MILVLFMLNLKLKMIVKDRSWSPPTSLAVVWAVLTIGLWLVWLKTLEIWRYFNQPAEFYSHYKNNAAFFAGLVGLLFLIWLVSLSLDWFINWKKKNIFYLVLIAFVLVSIIAVLIFPVGSMDLFCYLSTGRISGVNHLSPYFTTYAQLTNDLFFPALNKIVWAHNLSPYGPIAIGVNSLIAIITQNNILSGIIGFKLLALVINSLNAWLIYKLAGRRAFTLYAFNPLIIFELLINSHNEVLIIFFVLLSLWYLNRQKITSWLSLVLATLTKISALIFLPWYFFLSLKQKNLKTIFPWFLAASALILFFLAYYPLANHDWLVAIKSLQSQAKQSKAAFYSPLITLLVWFFSLLKIKTAALIAIIAGRSIFIIGYTWLLLRLVKSSNPRPISYYFLFSYGLLCLTGLTWLMPWYLTVLLVLLIIEQTRTNNFWLLIVYHLTTAYGLLYYLILR